MNQNMNQITSMGHAITEHQVKEIVDIFMTFTYEVRQDRLLDMLIFKMMSLSNTDASTLYIVKDGALHFHIVKNISLDINKGIEDESTLPPIVLDADNIENIAAYSAVRQETVIVEDVYLDARFNFEGTKNYDKLTGYRTKSMIVFPLISYLGNTPSVIGVMQFINAIDYNTGKFLSIENSMHLPLLKGISYMLSNTLSNMLQIQTIQTLYDLSTIDTLTGLGNRRYFNNVLAREWSISMRQKQPLGFLVIDIDHFKSVNDTYGHLCGDMVLKDIAAILSNTLRATDYATRWGGEEFAAILINTNLDYSKQVAEKIRTSVENAVFSLGEGPDGEQLEIKITISIGVNAIVVDTDSDDMITFISDTDMALYQAKKTGRNKVMSADEASKK